MYNIIKTPYDIGYCVYTYCWQKITYTPARGFTIDYTCLVPIHAVDKIFSHPLFRSRFRVKTTHMCVRYSFGAHGLTLLLNARHLK